MGQTGPGDDLRQLALFLNRTARETVERDGSHAAMFFLRTGTGSVQAGLFTEPAGERTGVARGRELATAVARTGADAVGCVAEVWSRPIGSIPRSTSDRGQDALLVAVIDREGRSIVLVTTIDRRDDGSVALGVSDEWTDGGYDLTFLEPVRALWASID